MSVIDILREPYNITLISFWAVHLTVWCILFFFSKKELFASRRLYLTILSNVGGLIMVTVICVREQDPAGFSCALYIVCSNAFVYLYGIGYVVRAVWLRFQHTLNEEICKHEGAFDFDSGKKAATWKSWVVLGLSIALAVHVTVAVMELLRLAREEGKGYLTHGCWLDFELEIFLIQFGVYLAVMIFMVCIIIKVSDAYWISSELRLCMAAWLLFGGMFFLFTLLPQLKPVGRLFPQSSWLLIAIGLTFIISDVLPLIVYARARRLVQSARRSAHYQELTGDLYEIVESENAQGMTIIRDSSSEDGEVETGITQVKKLERIMADDRDCANFKKMAMHWLRADLFQFCYDVYILKTEDMSEIDMRRHCETIYQKYLAAKSSAGDGVKSVHKLVLIQAGIIYRGIQDKKYNTNMFDAVYDRVTSYIESNMLPWFIRAAHDDDSSYISPYRLCCC